MRGEGEPGSRAALTATSMSKSTSDRIRFSSVKATTHTVRLPITFPQAALGAELDVPTIDGPYTFSLKEGTQPGEIVHDPRQGHPLCQPRPRAR